MISLPDELAPENWLTNASRESSTAAGEGRRTFIHVD
jgi:hypothetical protein